MDNYVALAGLHCSYNVVHDVFDLVTVLREPHEVWDYRYVSHHARW